MNEKPEKKAEKPERKKNDKYAILGLFIGLGMIAAGIAGIVTSLAAADDYGNSTDIRTVDAVIETIERSEEKHKDEEDRFNEHTNYIETIHKMKVSYVVDGKTYQGRYDVTTYSDSQESDRFYHQLKAGDTISVEVYRSRNGEYKMSPDTSPVDFLLYLAAIPVGLLITAAMIYGMVHPEPTSGKKKQQQQGKRR